MAQTNKAPTLQNLITTNEGAPARRISAARQLERSLNACLLWEKSFYENGISIAQRLADLVPNVEPETVAEMAVRARKEMHLRHAPLWLTLCMSAHASHRHLVADTLYQVIERADELSEALALYWGEDGKRPVAASVKKGLARAFTKFDAYQLAKYDRAKEVRLRDVMFLVHPEPVNAEQKEIFKQLANQTLPPPDTWERALSSGGDKQEHWTRLLKENKLGGMAMLRNLRNMQEAGVDAALIRAGLMNANFKRVLPFRFIKAAQYAPKYEPELEVAMLRSLAEMPKLPGKTKLLVDVSGSMSAAISSQSTLRRFDAANGLAILVRELAEEIDVYSFSTDLVEVPARRGFALRDAIVESQPHMSTFMGKAVSGVNQTEYDRLIVFSDEQTADVIPNPLPGAKAYMVNVSSEENGVGYGQHWHHITGWSEAIVQYIQTVEATSRV